MRSVTRPVAAVASIIAMALMATGCMPSKFSGYEPSGPGIREDGYCVAGVRDNLRVEAPHGVQVHWRASRDQAADAILLDVNVSVPDGVIVQLRSPDLVLSSEEWARPQLLPIAEISAPGPRNLAPDAQLAGSADASRGNYHFWYFPVGRGMTSKTGIPAVSAFSVQLPPLLINGDAWESAPVAFREFTRWGVYTCAQ